MSGKIRADLEDLMEYSNQMTLAERQDLILILILQGNTLAEVAIDDIDKTFTYSRSLRSIAEENRGKDERRH